MGKNDIITLWQAHRKSSLPDVPAESKGELWVLDEVVGGCVAYYLETDECLDPPRIGILLDCHDDLARLLPDLEGGAVEYFSRLGLLARLILSQTGAESPP